MCFDFRRARSHPLDPTHQFRFTRSGGNVHAKMRACQGAKFNQLIKKGLLSKELLALDGSPSISR